MNSSLLDAVVAGARRSAEMREQAVARDRFQDAWTGRHPRGVRFQPLVAGRDVGGEPLLEKLR